jgi:hypothetical protein
MKTTNVNVTPAAVESLSGANNDQHIQGVAIKTLPSEYHKDLQAIDLDGTGWISAQELAEAAVALKKAREQQHIQGVAIKTLPSEYHRDLQAIDLDGTGWISAQELAEAAVALKKAREQAKHFKRVVIGLSVGLVLAFCLILGGTFFAVKLAKEMKVGASDPALKVQGTETVIQTANAEMEVTPSGSLVMRTDPVAAAGRRLLMGDHHRRLMGENPDVNHSPLPVTRTER